MNSAQEILNIYNEFKQWYLLLNRKGHVNGKYHDIKTIQYQENESDKNYHRMTLGSCLYLEKAIYKMHHEIYHTMFEIMREDILAKREKEIENLTAALKKLKKIDIK